MGDVARCLLLLTHHVCRICNHLVPWVVRANRAEASLLKRLPAATTAATATSPLLQQRNPNHNKRNGNNRPNSNTRVRNSVCAR